MPEKNEIIIYTTPDGKETFEVNLKKDTVWLSQKQMAELFEKNIRTVNEHIGNIYKEKELIKSSTIRKFRIVQKEGNKSTTEEYSIVQMDGGIGEKATHLLFFVVKNHSFIDGNKRIAASLFLWFLNENKILYNKDGSKRLADNALVALTLLIAESKAEEKDTIIKVVVNLINQNN